MIFSRATNRKRVPARRIYNMLSIQSATDQIQSSPGLEITHAQLPKLVVAKREQAAVVVNHGSVILSRTHFDYIVIEQFLNQSRRQLLICIIPSLQKI